MVILNKIKIPKTQFNLDLVYYSSKFKIICGPSPQGIPPSRYKTKNGSFFHRSTKWTKKHARSPTLLYLVPLPQADTFSIMTTHFRSSAAAAAAQEPAAFLPLESHRTKLNTVLSLEKLKSAFDSLFRSPPVAAYAICDWNARAYAAFYLYHDRSECKPYLINDL